MTVKHTKRGLRPYTSNVAVLWSIGLTYIETELQSKSLMFFSQILMLVPDHGNIRVPRLQFIQAVFDVIKWKQGHVNHVVELARQTERSIGYLPVCFLHKSECNNVIKEKCSQHHRRH